MTTATIPTTPEVPPAGAPSAGNAPAPFSSVIPEGYRDRGYLKDIAAMPTGPEAYEALFKKLDGAETLIGKKGGIPAADAKPEEWDSFHAKLRPENADAYDFTVGKDADPVFIKTVKEAFFDAGATKGQAAKFVAKFEAAIAEQNKGVATAQKAHNDEFDSLALKFFGADKDKALAESKAMLSEMAPKEVLPYVGDLDNKALIVLASALRAVKKQYGAEDTLNNNGEGSGNTADAAALKAEGLKLLASPEYKDFTNPKCEEVRARVKAIYAQLGKMAPKE